MRRRTLENSFIAYGKVSIRYSGVFQRGCEEYKACAKLISGLVDCSIRTTTYLIMNGVLIYAVLCAAVVIGEDDVGVERLLPSEDVRLRCKAHSYQRISRDRERERERERPSVALPLLLGPCLVCVYAVSSGWRSQRREWDQSYLCQSECCLFSKGQKPSV